MDSQNIHTAHKMNKPAILLFVFIASLVLQNTYSQVRLPRLISNGMVIQRDVPVKIWGWASSAEKVSISFNGRNYNTVTGSDGKWVLILPPMPAGGPHTMEISASNNISIKNIVIGDVWICAGQSNMALPMERVKERYAGVIEQAENTFIRHFSAPTGYDFNTPREDFQSGNWESARPETVLRFSATAYFFARALYEKYQIPIGLINASVGGSPVEAWLSEDALKSFPSYLEMARICQDSNYINRIQEEESTITSKWYGYAGQHDLGLKGELRWNDTLYDASAWPTMQIPAFWSEAGLKNTHGIVWFRKEINVPSSMAGKPAKLFLGRIVDWDSVYVNGSFIGSITYQYPPRRYTIPPDILKAGKNIIVIKVINSSGQGGFIKDKPYRIISGVDTVDLAGAWKYQLGVAMEPLPSPTFFQYKPLGLFNGMIAPLLNYAMKGVIWYQGESNASRPADYAPLFSAMINDWRQKWNRGNFPFLYVQLANFMEPSEFPVESDWALLREAQSLTLAVPNTGMAVTSDIGEWNDIHPLNKEDVGKRLALIAQKLAYGDKEVVYSGPVYRSMKIKGNRVIIRFTHTGGGLMVKSGNEPGHFAIAGSDKQFVWAKASLSGNKVIVWSDNILQPAAVRYAWADNPESANLYNKEGLPAPAFRTDK
jgi:sialate O-acetylesterase